MYHDADCEVNQCIQAWLACPGRCDSCPKCGDFLPDPSVDYEWLCEQDVRQPPGWERLTEDAEQMALKAEELWRHAVEYMVEKLENMFNMDFWLLSEGIIFRRIIGLGTVNRFAEEHQKPGGSYHVPDHGYISEHWNTLCAHLDKMAGSQGDFLEPGEDHYIWLVRQHGKIKVAYEDLKHAAYLKIGTSEDNSDVD